LIYIENKVRLETPKSALTMANTLTNRKYRAKNILDGLNFRYLPNEENETLEALGYYRGFSCPFGHQIRDKKEHWCYHCVRRIQGNICGLDINYLHNIYQQDAREVLSLVEIKKPTECWPIHLEDDSYREYKTPKRINFPSYRTGQMDRRTDRVSIHKAIYTFTWGDVGSMRVSRRCRNKWCGNPLHMCSSWNRADLLKDFHYLDLELNPKKLLLMAKRHRHNLPIEDLIAISYRPTISSPQSVDIFHGE
jgi:hypothetical protein